VYLYENIPVFLPEMRNRSGSFLWVNEDSITIADCERTVAALPGQRND